MRPSRRDLMRMLAAGAMLPAGALASSASERKFLFLFVSGGWDPTWVFTPDLDDPAVWRDPNGEAQEAGGIRFFDGPGRPNVSAFFQHWGDRCAIINGMEVRSVTHDACRRIVLTGSTSSASDDWPALIAGNSNGWALPDLVISGPAFTARHSGVVMRVGPDGQLGKLLSGEALRDSDVSATALPDPATVAIESFLAERAAVLEAARTQGHGARFARDYSAALERLQTVRALGEELDLGVESSGYVYVRERVRPAIDCFRQGLSRTAVVEHLGLWDTNWDSHSGIGEQADHYNVLFEDLDAILTQLATTTGPAGGPLLDETTVVVLSEMGRAPVLNALGGKDHWTFTTAMLIGSGVRGGVVVGAYGDSLIGEPVDLATGGTRDSGTRLSAGNLGATLVAMAGLDVTELVPGHAPITAVIDGG